jgi:hypothetical protein
MTISDTPPTPAVCVSADDADFIANLLNPATAQIISLQTSDCEQPLDAYLDAVVAEHGHVVLECRHIGQNCIPHGPTWTVPLVDVIYLHIW